jgi:hypothetical protein
MHITTQEVLLGELEKVRRLITLKPGLTCKLLVEYLHEERIGEYKRPVNLPSSEGFIWKLMMVEYMGFATCLYGRWFIIRNNTETPITNNKRIKSVVQRTA